jgi:hypothetical protein
VGGAFCVLTVDRSGQEGCGCDRGNQGGVTASHVVNYRVE